MGSFAKGAILLLCIVCHCSSLILFASAQTPPASCNSFTFTQDRQFETCNSLPQLNATLHWNFFQGNSTIDIAFRAPQTSSGWVAWALNPTGSGMVGAQALVALMGTDGAMRAYTTPIDSKSPSMQQGNLSFPVDNLTAEFDNTNGVMIIFARITLPGGGTSINHLWQASTSTANGVPAGHALGGENILSLGSVDFQTGTVAASGNPLTPQSNTPPTSCDNFNFAQGRQFRTCSSLPQLGATLHWNYFQVNSTIDIAFRAPQTSSGWIAWALNPTGTGMVGAQTLVALMGTDGAMRAYTTPIDSKSPSMQQGNLSFPVENLTAEFDNTNGVMIIFARITLPGGRTSINHLWQASTSTANGVPAGHALGGENILSLGSVDFLTGTVAAGGNSLTRRRNVHGVLNAVSWGVLMPIGVIIARYMRVFKSADPAWFYLHITCQCSAYILGVAGWGTGLKLGSDSQGIEHTVHRNIGITLFTFATLQVFALLLRPQKDHKYRIFWNVYHHSIGYSVITLSIANIVKGFDILNPEDKWKNAYIGIISTLGAIAAVLEIATWIIVIKRRRSEKLQKTNYGANGHA